MKKILYTLFAVSLLAVGCTKEVGVSRDHDIDAEVVDMQTKMEMTTLYCNLNESNTEVNLDQLALYLTEVDADVVMFVAPTTINKSLVVETANEDIEGEDTEGDDTEGEDTEGGEDVGGETAPEQGVDFKTWLDAYAAEQGGLTVLVEQKNNSVLTMAALVKEKWSVEQYQFQQEVLNNAVLHFKANGIHFVVTELDAAKNAIPSDWQAQVATMTKNKVQDPLLYDPDNLAARKAELVYIIDQTVDNIAFVKDAQWMLAVNSNAVSSLDVTKYNQQLYRKDYYEPAVLAEGEFSWEEFLETETAYFSVSELLAADDIYFNVSNLMMYYDLIDCNAVHHSVYTPSTVEGDKDGERNNFLYATSECWNLFQTFDFDTAVASELGVAHYPIIVTLKSEE